MDYRVSGPADSADRPVAPATWRVGSRTMTERTNERNNEKLRKRAILERGQYSTIAAMEKETGVNRGTIFRVIYEKGNSPGLRRLWGIPKHPRRVRLTINCTEEYLARFDYLRGEMTRNEFLAMLLDKAVF